MQNKYMYKAIIFNLDGLLIDTEVISQQIYNSLLNHFNYSMSIEDYAQNYSGKPEIINSTKIINDYHLPLNVNEFINKVTLKETNII